MKKIRKTKGLKGREVVELLRTHGVHIALSSYYSWENNERNIPHDYIIPLCQSLNITVDFLYMVNLDSPLLKEKIEHIESIKNFLSMLDDNICEMLIYIAKNWHGDLITALEALGVYAAQPIESRRDIADLCLHNYLCAVRDGEADEKIANLIDVENYKKALDKLYKPKTNYKRRKETKS